MPELPEVESIVRGLEPKVLKQKVLGLRSSWPKAVLNTTPRKASRALKGRRLIEAHRRGKYFLFGLEGGWWFVGHLRMSGNLFWASEGTRNAHLRHRIIFEKGREIQFTDARKFGRLWLGKNPEEFLAHLGPEPFASAWTARRLHSDLAGRRRTLKPLLLDQSFLAGLGNIYVDESLYRAGVHPLRSSETVTLDEARRLHRAIRQTLREAIRGGGTSFDHALVEADGSPQGRYQQRLRVYGRVGRACGQCGTAVERLVVGQRGTAICPHCQPEPGF